MMFTLRSARPKRWKKVVIGMAIKLSAFPPSALPFEANTPITLKT